MKGRSSFEKGLRGLLKSHRLESSGDIQEVHVSGDLAYCWTFLTVRMTPLFGGESSHRSGSALSIFRKSSGTWALVRDANLLPSA
jgi:ketosteroid isomerase-like protein